MTDIVERLRDWNTKSIGCNPANAPYKEAADEIDRLRAENDMQRIVLKRALALVLEAARITRPALAEQEKK
jgi:hypothetical protein